jgi:hypothetical protein
MIQHPQPAFNKGNFIVKVVDGDFSSPSMIMVKHMPQRSSFKLPKPKKQVSFYPLIAVYPVLHIDDYSLSEALNVWYSKSEFQAFRDDCRRTVSAMMVKDGSLYACDNDSTNHSITDGNCARGLEHRTIQGIQHKRQCREVAWVAVLKEQDWQNKHGVSDPERIAYLYHMACSKSIRSAQQMA